MPLVEKVKVSKLFVAVFMQFFLVVLLLWSGSAGAQEKNVLGSEPDSLSNGDKIRRGWVKGPFQLQF
jgi:hypothetical protein